VRSGDGDEVLLLPGLTDDGSPALTLTSPHLLHTSLPPIRTYNTTVNITRNLVTEVGALSATGWAWSARGRHTLRWEVGVAEWAWSLHGKQT